MIWNQFFDLMRLACCMEPKTQPPKGLDPFTYSQWNVKAKAFGKAYCQRWGVVHFTTCLHIFIYHIGFYIEELGSVEKYGNYVIEGLHQQLKHGTNCFKDPQQQCVRWLNTSLGIYQLHHQQITEMPKETNYRRRKKVRPHWTDLNLD